MSQRDLVAELRAARVETPSEVRARVRLIVAAEKTPVQRPRFTWRRAFVVALPVAAAVAATIVFTRPAHETPGVRPVERAAVGAAAANPGTTLGKSTAIAPAPSTARVQRYGAELTLRVPTPNAVSNDVKQALQITKSLGGYASSVNAATAAKTGSAELTLRIPRTRVQEAITRLSALGTITSERVNIQDLQTGLDTTDRTIARLQRQLAGLRAQPQSTLNDHRIAALVSRIQALQRGKAATLRAARYATIDFHLTTQQAAVEPPKHGPLHGLAVAFRWLGIGAVYALALGAPLLLFLWLAWIAARTIRRRREDTLLSRS